MRSLCKNLFNEALKAENCWDKFNETFFDFLKFEFSEQNLNAEFPDFGFFGYFDF